MTRAEKISGLVECIPRLRSIAFSLLAPWEAEEVLQNTYRDALESIGSFEGRSSVYTWAVRILLRRGADYVRAEGRRRRLCPTWDAGKASRGFIKGNLTREEGTGTDNGGRFLSWEDTVADPGDSEQIIVDRLYLELIFSRLEEKDVEVLTLRFLEGYSPGEVAGILGISYEAARSQVRRSLGYALRAVKWMERGISA